MPAAETQITAPFAGTVIAVAHHPDEPVAAGEALVILEAMEHEVVAEARSGELLIGQLTPRHAAHFRRRQEIELPVLADEDRKSYKAAGAKVGSLGDLLGPKVVAKGALTSLRSGKLQGRTLGHPAQLGGAVVITPPGEIVWSRMAKDASDNASPEEILKAVPSNAKSAHG